jgi:hypothetical protein
MRPLQCVVVNFGAFKVGRLGAPHNFDPAASHRRESWPDFHRASSLVMKLLFSVKMRPLRCAVVNCGAFEVGRLRDKLDPVAVCYRCEFWLDFYRAYSLVTSLLFSVKMRPLRCAAVNSGAVEVGRLRDSLDTAAVCYRFEFWLDFHRASSLVMSLLFSVKMRPLRSAFVNCGAFEVERLRDNLDPATAFHRSEFCPHFLCMVSSRHCSFVLHQIAVSAIGG